MTLFTNEKRKHWRQIKVASSVLCTSSYRFHISSGYIWERKRERCGETNEKLSRVRQYLWDWWCTPGWFYFRSAMFWFPARRQPGVCWRVLKQQHDQCWVACAYLRKTSQNVARTYVRVFPVVAARGYKEAHSSSMWPICWLRYRRNSHTRLSPEFGNCDHAGTGRGRMFHNLVYIK